MADVQWGKYFRIKTKYHHNSSSSYSIVYVNHLQNPTIVGTNQKWIGRLIIE